MQKKSEQVFSERFLALAQVCRFDLDADGYTYAMYDQALSPLGYEKVNVALQKIFEERSSNDPFPSVKQIKAVMNESLAPEHHAPLLASKIIEAITRIGPYQTGRFREHVGEIGWRIVQMSGGVEQVCAIEDREIVANRSQWTKLAMSLILAGSVAIPDAKKSELTAPEARELKSLAHILSKIEEKDL